jgi:hypothetical protein
MRGAEQDLFLFWLGDYDVTVKLTFIPDFV